MKETKEEIKARIINDLANKNVKGISWLQKKYGIGFKLAEEIYLNYCKEKAHPSLFSSLVPHHRGFPTLKYEFPLAQPGKTL